MGDSVPVNTFVVPVLNIQIGLGNGFLINMVWFFDSDVVKLYIGEEVVHNTLVALS